MARKVFISYCKGNSDKVNQFLSLLPEDYFDIWVDYQSLRYGTGYTTPILKAISESDIYLIFLSKESSESNWVAEELEYAMQESISTKKLEIAGVILDETPIPVVLKHKHLINGRYSVTSAADEFVKGFQYKSSDLSSDKSNMNSSIEQPEGGKRHKNLVPVFLSILIIGLVTGFLVWALNTKSQDKSSAEMPDTLGVSSDIEDEPGTSDFDKEKMAQVLEEAELLALKGEYESALAKINAWHSMYPEIEELSVKKKEYSEKIEQSKKEAESAKAAEAKKEAEQRQKEAERKEKESVFHVIESSNLRSKPDHGSALVETIMDGTVDLYYRGETGEGFGSDGLLHTWYKVYVNNGKTGGWIRSDLVKEVTE